MHDFVSQSFKDRLLHSLGQDIGEHLLGGTIRHCNGVIADVLPTDRMISDVNISGSALAYGVVRDADTRLVVFEDSHWEFYVYSHR